MAKRRMNHGLRMRGEIGEIEINVFEQEAEAGHCNSVKLLLSQLSASLIKSTVKTDESPQSPRRSPLSVERITYSIPSVQEQLAIHPSTIEACAHEFIQSNGGLIPFQYLPFHHPGTLCFG